MSDETTVAPKGMDIGGLRFTSPIFLAPMAGVTDGTFRRLVRQNGCQLCFGEMVSAKAVCYRNEKTLAMLKTTPDDRPFALQLFGNDPKTAAEAAKYVESTGYADIIDFNMGCPVPKIVNNGEGSALMKNPKLAHEILSALRAAVKLPVTVKIRKGFDESSANAVEIARLAEDAGVAAVTVHGRTREQYYSGKADWDIIAAVKAAVKIPVIGNGDVCSATDLQKIFAVTRCDGVMIGRAAQGNPWIFAALAAAYAKQSPPSPPTSYERAGMMLTHMDMLIADKGEYTGLREMRKHAAWYTKGQPGGAKLRDRINRAETREEFAAIIKETVRNF